MEILESDFFQWLRVIVYALLAATTFYNAARFKSLMKLWFVFLGLFFMGLVGSVYLHIIDSPYYDDYTNGIFSPIVVVLFVISLAFVINHHIKPPFNRRKDDV